MYPQVRACCFLQRQSCLQKQLGYVSAVHYYSILSECIDNPDGPNSEQSDNLTMSYLSFQSFSHAHIEYIVRNQCFFPTWQRPICRCNGMLHIQSREGGESLQPVANRRPLSARRRFQPSGENSVQKKTLVNTSESLFIHLNVICSRKNSLYNWSREFVFEEASLIEME